MGRKVLCGCIRKEGLNGVVSGEIEEWIGERCLKRVASGWND